MVYKKKDYPKIGEILICKVKKILSHSTIAVLEEYEDKEGVIHISEVSPGRIRNIRDFIREGKEVVCKVLRVDEKKGYIDLSLRRVNAVMKIRKINEYKQEQKAEKLLELILNKKKKSLSQVYEKCGKLFEEYGTLTNFFNTIVEDNFSVKDIQIFGFEKDVAETLEKEIKEKIKLPEAKLKSILKLMSYDENGVGVIKEVFKKCLSSVNKEYDVGVICLGSPKYEITIKGKEYKEAEKELNNLTENIIKEIKTKKGIGEKIG